MTASAASVHRDTHPELERLAAAWTTLLPNITAGHQHDGGPLLSAAFERSLARLCRHSYAATA